MNKKVYIATIFLASACMLPSQADEQWDLKRCIEYAIEHNITIKQQEASQEQNEIELSTARWNRLPNLNGSASHSFNFGRSLQSDNTYKNINIQNTGFNLSTNIPIFTGLQLINNVALAKLNLKAAIEDLNKAKEDISIQITSAYLQILFNQELAKVAHEQVALSKELLTQKEAFFKAGKASEAEWLEAKARVAQDELSAVQADNNYNISLLELTQLLELPTPEGFGIVAPATEGEDAFVPLTAPEEIYAGAVQSKPGIKAAQYRLEGAEKNIRIAQGAYYPQLSLGAGLGTSYYKMSGNDNPSFSSQLKNNFSQYVGISLSIPIFNRFSTRNRVRSARVQQMTLGWQLEDSKKTLYKEIQQAYYNAVAAEKQYRSSMDADKAAYSSFKLTKEKYTNGKATATEYNEGRTNWLKTVSDRIQAKYDYLFRTKILDFYKGIPLTLE